MENTPALRTEHLPALPMELSVEAVLAQIKKIQLLMAEGMKMGEHYGVIPGTGDKPTLLKPGAEKLCLMFRFDPEYAVSNLTDGDHLTILSTCTLYHIPTGMRVGSGMGSCSTKESKYAYRRGSRKCPKCGKEAIFKDKKAAGYYCWSKKDGCGAQFKSPAEIVTIESQDTGRVENPDKADQYNTVLKIANKRSLVAAVLNATAASDIFTQDLEEVTDKRHSLESEDEDQSASSVSRQKPTDKITPEQWKLLNESALRAFGQTEGRKWLGTNRASSIMTLEVYQRLLTELGDVQPPAPDDGDDEMQRSFDQAQAAKETGAGK